MENRGQIGAIVGVLVVLIALGIGWLFMSKRTRGTGESQVAWQYDQETWRASGTAPTCDTPLLKQSPVDVTQATAVLYPGQTRGGNYKPHGGFIFGGQPNNAITVSLPVDATLWRGSRYIEQGETQYMFDFIAPCGLAIRFDHLATLSSTFQKYADMLPEPQVDQSRTQNLEPVSFRAGEVIATGVGFMQNNNTSVDFGLYDLRQRNAASAQSTYAQQHQQEAELAFYAVCWLDHLPTTDAATVKALPGGDMTSGKTSDYCR